ncbi:DUF4365 domain-containing protein [Actinoallomurus sp. CA-150999]|uniref:DUF4365 domain-containing protein n=1 Tax=Actinoallomurus sp. CA-150999 TaxID=3239887 RepID=UPI003D94A94F
MSSGSQSIPPDGLPPNEMKQQLSLAYLHMVTAAAGCSLKDHKTDYDGVDVTVVSSAGYERYYAPQFELQLKCTSQTDLLSHDHLAWQLERKPFLNLTNRKRYIPAYLGIPAVHEDLNKWLDQDEDRLIARSCMYWQSATELGTISDDCASKTVHLPRSNLFDVSQLLDIMKSIGEGGDW